MSLKNNVTSYVSLIISVTLIAGCIIVCSDCYSLVFLFSVVFPILFLLNLILLFFLLIKKNKLAVFPVLGLILFLFRFSSPFQLNHNRVKDNVDSTLSILTYNTKNFEPNVEEEKIINFVKEKQPDLILFQEFSAIKYKYFIDDYKYWVKTNMMAPNKSVLAIFSKYPIVEKGVIEFPNSKNNAVFVDISYNNQKLRIYNLHLESFKFKKAFFEGFSDHILYRNIFKAQERQKEQVRNILSHTNDFSGKIIICGDFNCTQFSPTYLELKKGRKDSFIEKGNGFGSTYNFKWYPLRLDYVLVDSEIEVLSHTNFQLEYSDHEPILVKLKLN